MVTAWIGVDLDGTLFTYHKWVGWNVFGEPIVPMVERIKAWLAEGKEVRIVTARIGLPIREERSRNETRMRVDARPLSQCLITGQMFSDLMMQNAVQDHLVTAGLPRLACSASRMSA